MTTVLMGWGVMITGALAIGQRGTGIRAAYQTADDVCGTYWVDTDRPVTAYTHVQAQAFCLFLTAWSPNHRYAALAFNPSGALQIAVGRRGNDWGQVYDVPQTTAIQHSMVWSPDSSQLAFMVGRGDLTIIGLVRMTNDKPNIPHFMTIKATQPILTTLPAWSPDGRWIAFGAYDTLRLPGNEELYLLDVTSGDVQRLTQNTYLDDMPSWSPDGRALVFTSGETGSNELYVLDVTTRQRHRITTFTTGYQPHWSPDGHWILFVSNLDYAYDVYIIGADGFGLRRLTYQHSAAELLPVWMP